MLILGPVTVVGGHLSAPYLADPGTIPHSKRVVVAYAAAAIVFLVVSTLSQLTSLMMLGISLPSVKKFLTTLGSFSLVGLILGTALGFRVGMHLFDQADRDPTRYGVPELLGTISDTVTIMTLIMVAFTWPFSAWPYFQWARGKEQPTVTGRIRIPSLGRLRPWLVAVILFGGNAIGVNAAGFAYQILTH